MLKRRAINRPGEPFNDPLDVFAGGGISPRECDHATADQNLPASIGFAGARTLETLQAGFAAFQLRNLGFENRYLIAHRGFP